jgi:hypothetical protein
MRSVDEVGVTFVNTVIGRGSLNGIINLQLGVFQFSPNNEDQEKVDVDHVVACRLRMDRMCAKNLYETLGDLLGKIEKAEAAALTPASAEVSLNGSGTRTDETIN